MEKFASVMADGIRVNESMARREEAATSHTADTTKPQATGGTGRFASRMSMRRETEETFHAQRQGKQITDTTALDGGGGVAELEGDMVRKLPLGNATAVTAGPSMGEGQAGRGLVSKFKEVGLSPGSVGNNVGLGRVESFMTTPTKKGEKKEVEVTSGNKESKLPVFGRQSRRSAFFSTQAGPSKEARSAGLARSLSKKLSPRTVKLDMVREPGSAVSRPVNRTLQVNGTDFDLIDPHTAKTMPPPPTTLPPPPIPPRTSSKNFSMTQHKENQEKKAHPKCDPKLQALPEDVRGKIFRLVLVAEHEVLVCTCDFDSCKPSAQQPALAQVSSQFRDESMPIYYGENKYMLRGTYDWNSEAPNWLQAMPQATRNLITHVEVCTHDIASAVCMMATLGFQLSYRMPKKHQLELMTDMLGVKAGGAMWMTFTAIQKVLEEYEKAHGDDASIKSFDTAILIQ